VELYLFGKWFNIYEIYDRDDQLLKAWYCNITRPVRLLGNEVHYDDLALDLLVFLTGGSWHWMRMNLLPWVEIKLTSRMRGQL
jgi:protein associated with RNAse G/E